MIDRDTQFCMSIAARPGHFGTRFHNFLYRELGLNFLYKAFAVQDPVGAIMGIRALNIRGCAVSMPFKEVVIGLVDEVMPSAAAIRSSNTVVNDGGVLRAYNTDYVAVEALLRLRGVTAAWPFALAGSGGMARAVAGALRTAGFDDGLIVARNADAGSALSAACGYRWAPAIGDDRPALLINCTPVGMAEGPAPGESPFPAEAVATALTVFDVVARPPETPLISMARSFGRPVITGADVIVLQAVEQFELYTGLRPDEDLIRRAAAFALSERPELTNPAWPVGAPTGTASRRTMKPDN